MVILMKKTRVRHTPFRVVSNFQTIKSKIRIKSKNKL